MSKGCLVLVVGPSGAGKDTLLAHAALQLAHDGRFIFPKRQVTRDTDAASEDHDSLSREEFNKIHASGECLLSWEAHGLGYVIPDSVRHEIARGHIAVCNGSRRMLPDAVARFPDCRIIIIEAERSVRANRLTARGREAAEDIEARLRRDVTVVLADTAPIRVDNSGLLEHSVVAFVEALKSAALPIRDGKPG